MLDIPYVGSIRVSAVCLDKHLTKKLLKMAASDAGLA